MYKFETGEMTRVLSQQQRHSDVVHCYSRVPWLYLSFSFSYPEQDDNNKAVFKIFYRTPPFCGYGDI